MPRKKVEKAIPEIQKRHIAVYIRVSTDEQADSGLGLEAQKAKCTAMAMVSDLTDQIVIYADEGVSGTKPPENREGFAKLLVDINDNKVSAVIVSALDRLGRKSKYITDMVYMFEKKKVEFISCKERYDTSTPQGKFVTFMFSALAELERDLISQRTKDALAEKGKITGERGGNVPYGYKRVFRMDEQLGKKRAVGILIDPEKAVIVNLIFTLHERQISMWKIAEKCKSLASPPHGTDWYASTIKEILSHRDNYTGGHRGNSPVRWPAILEGENNDAIQ